MTQLPAAKVICDVCATKVGAGNIYGIAQHAVFQCRRIVVDESLTAAFFRDLLDNCCRVEIKPAALSTVISLQLRELIGIKAYADGYRSPWSIEHERLAAFFAPDAFCFERMYLLI